MALIVLDDPEDPTPYWLVSSRQPETLAASLRSATARLAAGQLPREG